MPVEAGLEDVYFSRTLIDARKAGIGPMFAKIAGFRVALPDALARLLGRLDHLFSC